MNAWRIAAFALALAVATGARAQEPRTYELSTSVVAGSVDNQVDLVVRHSNTSDTAVDGVKIDVVGSPRYLTDIRITPASVSRMRPNERSIVTVKFNVRPNAPQEQVETLTLQLTPARGAALDYSRAAVTMRFIQPVDAAARAPGAADLVDVVNVRGLHIVEIESRLRAAGLTPEFVGGTPAPTRAQEYTAQDQNPRAGAPRVPRGSKVAVTMHSEYRAPEAGLVLLERLLDLPQAQAEDRLKAAGLVPDYIGGGLPSTRAQEYTVESQSPPADGRRVARGSVVTLAIRSGFAEPAPPPRVAPVAPAPQLPVPQPIAQPAGETRMPAQSPTPFPTQSPPPTSTPSPTPSPTPPPAQAAPQAPSENPLCPTILATAKMAADSGRLDDALNLYSQARAQRCNAPGIEGEVARIQAAKQQQAQRARACDDLIQRGNAALGGRQYQAAADLYSQARQSGCNNAGLDGAINRARAAAAQQQQHATRCNGLVQAGNQASNAGRWQEAINYWRQAQGAQCDLQGLDGAIAGAEARIRQAAEAQARARQPTPPAPAPAQRAASPASSGGMTCECKPGSYPYQTPTLLGQSEHACMFQGRLIPPDYNCRPRR